MFIVHRLDTGSDTIGVLANGVRKDVLRVENEFLDSPTYSPTGHLLYHRDTNIPGTYPKQTGQWQVSSGGGSTPIWSRLGDAIYYRDTSGQVVRVDVRTTPSVTLGAPVVIKRPSSLVARAGFDVSLDGTRLLMVDEVKTDEQRQAALAVVQNWIARLRK